MDIKNLKFGKLSVIKKAERSDKYARWHVRCECGRKITVSQANLLNGKRTSCGCDGEVRKIRHGMHGHDFYWLWHAMKQRCGKDKNYLNIKVCDEWIKFEGFMQDMYGSYLKHIEEYGKKETLLDRINGKGDYCKDNCRWATRIEQNRNMKSNVNLTFNGKTQCVAAWAKELGYNPRFFEFRLKRGWSVEETLTLPPRCRRA